MERLSVFLPILPAGVYPLRVCRYRDDPRIQAMVLIGQYFEENNVAEFQRVLQVCGSVLAD